MHIPTPRKMDTLFLGVFNVVPRCVLWLFVVSTGTTISTGKGHMPKHYMMNYMLTPLF